MDIALSRKGEQKPAANFEIMNNRTVPCVTLDTDTPAERRGRTSALRSIVIDVAPPFEMTAEALEI